MLMKRFLDSPTSELFEVYHTVFRKTYEMNSEEGMQRMQNFEENVRFMNEHKAAFPSLEITSTTDLPHEMWRSLINLELDTSFSDVISVGSVRINGLCLTPASTAEGSAVSLQRCTWHDNQNWKLTTGTMTGYNSIVHASSGRYLSILNNSKPQLGSTSASPNSLNMYGKSGLIINE